MIDKIFIFIVLHRYLLKTISCELTSPAILKKLTTNLSCKYENFSKNSMGLCHLTSPTPCALRNLYFIAKKLFFCQRKKPDNKGMWRTMHILAGL